MQRKKQKGQQNSVYALASIISTKKLRSVSLLMQICLFIALFSQCLATQIQIISNPTQEHLKSVNLMKSLRKFRVRYINLKNDTYACVTAVKQKPLDTDSSGKSKQTNAIINGNLPTQFSVDANLFQEHLNLLDDGMVLRHNTKQFIYGYKHKQILSQFDDDITKYNNQKKQHQNFTMGFFKSTLVSPDKIPEKVSLDYHVYNNDHIRAERNKGDENFVDNKNQKPLSNKYVHEAIKYAHIDYLNSMIILTHPLSAFKHEKSNTYNVTFQCQQRLKTDLENETEVGQIYYYNYTIIGVSLSNYQIQLVSNVPPVCKKVISLIQAKIWIMSFVSGLNVLDKKLFGDVQQTCGVPTDRGIHPGDFLILETERKADFIQDEVAKKKLSLFNVQYEQKVEIGSKSGQTITAGQTKKPESENKQKDDKITQYFLIRIDEVIGENLYEMNQKVPWTVKPKRCNIVQFKSGLSVDFGGQIKVGIRKATKQYEFENPQADKLIEMQLINSKMVRRLKDSNQMILQPGQQLFCMVQAIFVLGYQYPSLQTFSLTVGQSLGEYNEIFLWIGSRNKLKMYDQSGYLGSKINCLAYKHQITYSNEESKKQNNKEETMKSMNINPISEVYKISKNSPNKIKVVKKTNTQQTISKKNIYNRKQVQKINQDSIIMITLTRDAIVQVHTEIIEINEEEKISPAEPESLENSDKNELQTENNSKKIVGVNKYLMNSQKIYKIQTHFKNGTKIRVERMENQFYENSTNENAIVIYRGIWRAGDFVKFPRFIFRANQKITHVTVKFGSAFVRVFDLSIINPQLFIVSSPAFLQHQGFGPYQRPVKSKATQHQFKWGNFCGGTINKNRQTTIKIKCGESWYKIVSVVEVSPCSYEIQIITQFLCDKNTTFPALKNGFSIFSGSMCLPANEYLSI